MDRGLVIAFARPPTNPDFSRAAGISDLGVADSEVFLSPGLAVYNPFRNNSETCLANISKTTSWLMLPSLSKWTTNYYYTLGASTQMAVCGAKESKKIRKPPPTTKKKISVEKKKGLPKWDPKHRK